MQTTAIVSLLEDLRGRLTEMDIKTEPQAAKSSEQHSSSSSAARKKLKALKDMAKAGRSGATTIAAKRGYPSSSSRR